MIIKVEGNTPEARQWALQTAECLVADGVKAAFSDWEGAAGKIGESAAMQRKKSISAVGYDLRKQLATGARDDV